MSNCTNVAALTPVPTLSDVCRLLTRVFGREVDRSLYDALCATGVGLVGRCGAEDSELEALAAEYCRMFLPPSACCPPYGSVQLGEAALRARTETVVLRFVERAGYDLELHAPVVAADHVAIIFELLGALSSSDADDAPQLLGEFLDSVVLPWVPDFLTSVVTADTHGLYAAAAELGLDVLLPLMEGRAPGQHVYAAPTAHHAGACVGGELAASTLSGSLSRSR